MPEQTPVAAAKDRPMDATAFNPENPPELKVAQWFNAAEPLSLAKLKGRVVVLLAFQMQCPGALRHSLPQAQRIARAFNDGEVAVIGLHTVFEDHEEMTPALLEAYLKQEHIEIPVAVDKPNGTELPQTMDAYGMQGTPTLLLFDRQGRLRRHYLGAVDDVRLGAEIMALAIEDAKAPREASIAIEQRLAAALVDPQDHHHHDGDCCGGHHAHDHKHAHDHAHDHAGGCCGHDHAHAHAHDHDHEGGCCGQDHAHGDDHAHPETAAQATAGKKDEKGGCGDPGCGCH